MRSIVTVVTVTLAACAANAPSTVVILPSPAYSSASSIAREDSAPAGFVAIDARDTGAWVRSLPNADRFAVIDLSTAPRVLLTWHIGASRDDYRYPTRQAQSVDLVLTGGGSETSIFIAERASKTNPSDTTYCARRGFHLGDSDSGWGFSDDPAVASAFMVWMLVDLEYALVARDRSTLHLLVRRANEQRCVDELEGAKHVCAHFERRAEIHIAPAAKLYETIDDNGHPFNCSADMWGHPLRPP